MAIKNRGKLDRASILSIFERDNLFLICVHSGVLLKAFAQISMKEPMMLRHIQIMSGGVMGRCHKAIHRKHIDVAMNRLTMVCFESTMGS